MLAYTEARSSESDRSTAGAIGIDRSGAGAGDGTGGAVDVAHGSSAASASLTS